MKTGSLWGENVFCWSSFVFTDWDDFFNSLNFIEFSVNQSEWAKLNL